VLQFDQVTGSFEQLHLGRKPDPAKTVDHEIFPGYGPVSLRLEDYPTLQARLNLRQTFAVRLADSNATPADIELLEVVHSRSLLAIPVLSGDQVAALLMLLAADAQAFPDSEIRWAELLADQVNNALEYARLLEREKQRRQVADSLRSVAETISSQLEFDELLNIILQKLALVLNYDSANVQLLREDKLVIIGGRGWEDRRKVLGLSFPMAGYNPNRVVLETQEAVIVSDTQAEYPASFGPPLHHRTRSWLGVPLTYGTQIFGLMALDKYQPGFFTPEDAEVVSAFANQVAVSLQNARLFEEARQQVRQLAALTEVAQSINRALPLNDVLNLVLDAVFDLVGYHNGSIWLIDSSSDTVKIANTRNISDVMVELFNESHISVGSEPFVAVIQSGKVLTIEGSAGEDQIAHYGLPFPDDVTYVPLKTEEGVIGILAIEAIISDRNMLEMVTTLADLAAVAIDSARLLEDTRRRATEMQHLYKLGVEVSGMLDVRQVMRAVISKALSLSNSHVGAILFWDEETSQYIIEGTAITDDLAARFGLSQADRLEAKFTKQHPLSLWSDLIRRLVEADQPIVANLTEADLEPSAGAKSDEKLGQAERVAKRLGVQAILGVPIPIQNEINGAVFVSSLTPRNYDSRDIQSVSLAANQASVAVRNAQLVHRLNLLTEELEQRVALRTEELAKTLQDLTEERDRVEVLYEIGRELSTSFDLDRVLTEALHIINRAIGISLGSILLLDPESGHLAYRAALGRDISLPRGGLQTRYQLGYGLAGKVMEAREPRLVGDLGQDPDWVPTELADDRRSAIVVPLTTGDEVLGALMLFHPEPDYFRDDQLKLVSAAGAQIAIAVNNAELYRLITDQAERLGVMYRQQAAEAAKNQAILQGITDGVLVLDVDRHIVLVNPKAAEILNIKASEVEGQPLPQILGRSGSPEELKLAQLFYDRLLPSLAEIEAGAPSAQFRIEARPKAVMVSLAPVAFGSEELPSIVALLRDISRQAEVERLKNEFISTVSHELRTPMTSIKGFADLLLSDTSGLGDLNQKQTHFVSIIQSNANRLTDLVNDILEISRIETGRITLKFAAMSIIELIKDAADAFEAQMAEKSLDVSLQLPDSLPNVYADKARLTQILVNLVSNAWQYTPEGGRIDIYANAIGGYMQIDVADSGIGIVEQDVKYIFDRFFRSERPDVQVVDGTGLGLSITKSFVEMLGGQIWVKSEVDVGSTFSFTIPLDVTGQDGKVTILDRVEPKPGTHLLVISDDERVYNLLNSDLQNLMNQQLVILNNGQEALNFARNASATISLILLDVVLRDSDSLVLLERIKKDSSTADIPVILSSLSADEPNQSLVLHPVDYIDSTAADVRILDSLKLTLSGLDADGLQARRLGLRPPSQLLIVENDWTTSSRLKGLLSNAGYDVHCAFNGRQALDMALGNKPELILISAEMPNIGDQTVISRLHYEAGLKNIPLVLIVNDAEVFWAHQVAALTRTRFAGESSQAIPVDKLLTELLQIEAALNSA
jgi:signal transduction histidine kinase/DNA-binding response OmpR family regulator